MSLRNTIATISISSLLAFSPLLNLVTNSHHRLHVYAMTEAQVLERLNGIPVFAITDDKGAPLLGALPQQPNRPRESRQLMMFFLSPDDAQALLTRIRTANPTVASRARVSILSFNQAYQTIRQNQNQTIAFEFVPARASLESARTLVKAQGRADRDVPPMPIFFATSGTGDRQGLLTLETDGRQTVPFFFDQRDLQSMLERARQQQPNLARDAKIQVTSLYQVLDSMITRDNRPNPEASKFQFVPARNAFEYVVRTAPNQQNRPTGPATRPAPPRPAR